MTQKTKKHVTTRGSVFPEAFVVPALRNINSSFQSFSEDGRATEGKTFFRLFSSNLIFTLVTYRNYPKNTPFYFFTLFLAYPKLFTWF